MARGAHQALRVQPRQDPDDSSGPQRSRTAAAPLNARPSRTLAALPGPPACRASSAAAHTRSVEPGP